MASNNVVAAVTAHVQGLIAQGNTTPQTPAQYGTACGYPGSKASALRKHIARQHGAGAYANGAGRYPPVTPKQMLALLQGGHVASKAGATAAQRTQAAAQAKRTFWQRKASKASKAAAQGKATAQVLPPTPATAQPTQPTQAAQAAN